MSNPIVDVDLNGYEMFDRPTKRSARKQKRTASRQAQKETNNPVNVSLQMRPIAPKTVNQEKVFNDYNRGKHIVNLGVAGSGKSFVSMYLALNEILNKKSDKKRLIIVRSAVAARDQGFLPGSLQQKMAVFESPYIAICKNLFGRSDAYEILKKRGIIQFESTSFMRGETFDDSIVLYDEIQNAGYNESLTVITRLGDNSRLMIAGDYGQDDLVKSKYDISGLREIMRILDRMREVSTTYFTVDDICRSGFVKSFYKALYSIQAKNEVDPILPEFLTKPAA